MSVSDSHFIAPGFGMMPSAARPFCSSRALVIVSPAARATSMTDWPRWMEFLTESRAPCSARRPDAIAKMAPLSGYRWGIERKRALLDKEAKNE